VQPSNEFFFIVEAINDSASDLLHFWFIKRRKKEEKGVVIGSWVIHCLAFEAL
jgi:hypothetical protein